MFNIFHKNKKYTLPYLETHIVDHCNLKCKGCSHFSHLVENEVFVNVDEFQNDIEELSKKINFKVIFILGGEPLLHPEINKFIVITRKAYPLSQISILTNGILLHTMNKEFWNTVRDNKIRISISKYPILGNKFSEILDLIDDKQVLLGDIRLSKRFVDKLNKTGTSNPQKVYDICTLKRGANLWNHNLYVCQACYREIYNKKYNKNIVIPKPINFYKMNAKEIYNLFNNRPQDACRYCKEQIVEFEWKQYLH